MPSIILVADDELPITQLLVEALTDEGYIVKVVHDGASALLTIQSEPPDLVILDNAMPVMTGAEVLSTLRDKYQNDTPIIISSAALHLETFLERGANAIVPKPFDLNILLATVEAILKVD